MTGVDLRRIGKRVAQRRRECGMTQEILAEKMEVSTQMVSSLERGRTAVRIDNLVKLHRILRVSCDWLLTGESTADDRAELTAKLAQLSEKDYRMIEWLVDYRLREE